ALTKAQSHKGVSYHRVTTIIFDEFIIEKGYSRYITGNSEWDVLLNFYSTVDRNQDKTRVYFCANSVSMMNPYMMKLEIVPNEVPEFSTYHDGFAVVHFVDSDAFSESVYKTRWGKFIQGTE